MCLHRGLREDNHGEAGKTRLTRSTTNGETKHQIIHGYRQQQQDTSSALNLSRHFAPETFVTTSIEQKDEGEIGVQSARDNDGTHAQQTGRC